MSDQSRLKPYYMAVLGTMVASMFILIFLRFLNHLNKYLRKQIKIDCRFQLAIWFLIFATETMFLTFIRPAGRLKARQFFFKDND